MSQTIRPPGATKPSGPAGMVFSTEYALPDEIRHPHSRYVHQQLDKGGYFPLYYITLAGRAAAATQKVKPPPAIKVEHGDNELITIVNAVSTPQLKGFVPDRWNQQGDGPVNYTSGYSWGANY